MRMPCLLLLVNCTEADIRVEPQKPVLDEGCGLAYPTPPDMSHIEERYKAIPGSCIDKLDDPFRGPRCRSLMEKSLAGYFGEPARLEAIRVLGVQP